MRRKVQDIGIALSGTLRIGMAGRSGSRRKRPRQKAAAPCPHLMDLVPRKEVLRGTLYESVQHEWHLFIQASWAPDRGDRLSAGGSRPGSSSSIAICVQTLRHSATAFSLCTR